MKDKLIPEEIQEAIEKFRLLPGVGEKSAMRNILRLLSLGTDVIKEFTDGLEGLTKLKNCSSCGIYSDSDEDECSICLSEDRKKVSTICVVENYNDFLAIERSEHYKGFYHCLGGVLNPLLGVGPDDLSISKLVERVRHLDITNIILAINPTLEGQATCSYLKEVLSPYCHEIERIGFGMPIGGSLEYLDAQTISTAMANKKSML